MNSIRIPAGIVAAILVASAMFVVGYRAQQSIPLSPDEVSWVFHSRSVVRAIEGGDVQRTSWETYESFDHPPGAKYFFGLILWSRFDTFLQHVDEAQAQFGRWGMYANPEVHHELSGMLAQYIYTMRSMSLTLFMGIGVTIFWLAYTVTRRVATSLLLVVVCISNPIVIAPLVVATSDSLMVLLSLLAVTIGLYAVRSSSIAPYFLFGIVSGFAASTKITGAVIIIGYYLYETMAMMLEMGLERIRLARIALTFCAAALVWVLINPTVWFSPVGNTIRYAQFRLLQSAMLQRAYPEDALSTVNEQLEATFCSFSRCGATNGNVVLLVFQCVLLSLALIAIWKKRFYRNPRDLFLITTTITMTAIISVAIPLNWDRYYLYPIFGLTVLSAYGASYGLQIIRRRVS